MADGKTCVICQETASAAVCSGCNKSFCIQHFMRHRLLLAEQMDGLFHQYRLLKKDLDHSSQYQTLLTNIFAWERRSMNKIHEIAEAARKDLDDSMDRVKKHVSTSIDSILSKFELKGHKNHYTEVDLQTLTTKLAELRNLIENLTNVSLITDEHVSSGIAGIKIVEQKLVQKPDIPPSTESEADNFSDKETNQDSQHFVRIFGKCTLSDGDTLVKQLSYSSGLSQLTGSSSYSFGKHSITFLIENKGNKNIFIGIHSSSPDITSAKFDRSIYGWWSPSYVMINGECNYGADNETIKTGDKITLTIDCDHQKLEYKCHRTKTPSTLPVQLGTCPLPWKLLIRLMQTGDSIRILRSASVN